MSDCSTTIMPGIVGDIGNDGTNGTNGISAKSVLLVPFTMPAEGGNAIATVDESDWLAPGQFVYLQNGGTVQVLSTGTGVVTLINARNTALSLYTGNVAPGTVIPGSSLIVATGQQGVKGQDGVSGAPTGAAYVLATSNPSLLSAFNLGGLASGLLRQTVAAGVAAPAIASDGIDYLSPVTGLIPADLGVSVQAFDANLLALAGLAGSANKLPIFTGAGTMVLISATVLAQSLLAATTVGVAQSVLGLSYVLLGSALAVNLSSANNDNAITIGATRYRIDRLMVDNGSISLTTATAGLFTAAGGGGITIAADQALSALTATTKFKDLTLQAIVGTDCLTAGTVYFRSGTAQGAPATTNVYIFGWRIS